jgi:hypothetical protein
MIYPKKKTETMAKRRRKPITILAIFNPNHILASTLSVFIG